MRKEKSKAIGNVQFSQEKFMHFKYIKFNRQIVQIWGLLHKYLKHLFRI